MLFLSHTMEKKKLQCFLIFMTSTAFTLCGTLVDAKIISKSFSKKQVCHLQDRINNGCAELQDGVKSLLDCSTLCRQNCSGVLRTDSGLCYLAKPCSSSFPSCGSSDTPTVYYTDEIVCQHGVHDKDSNTCQCVDGWVGETCERRPDGCKEQSDYRYKEGLSLITLEVDGYPSPFPVFCLVSGVPGVHTTSETMIMANSGKYINKKTWQSYVEGWTYDQEDLFLGLTKIKALNDAGLSKLTLRLGLWDEGGRYNKWDKIYNGFKMSDSSLGYSFDFSSQGTSRSGGNLVLKFNMADCMAPIEFGRFSTFDHDDDGLDTENCADVNGVGWWFKGDCNMICNPMGYNYQYRPGPQTMEHFNIPNIDLSNQTYASNVHISMYLSE